MSSAIACYEYTMIPHFALFRQACTVIVRFKTDAMESRCQPEPCPGTCYPRIQRRTLICVQCDRTRTNSQYSDCDSDYVARCRSYRSSSAKSRYVNVCAAVCLVLLVGGLFPQSSAAPHKRTMDRQRRSTSQENSLWGNPCDYGANPVPSKYSGKLAKEVSSQARNAFESTAKYRDTFALKLHSYQSFDELLKVWSSSDWLRNFTWFPEEGLPKDKVLYQPMSEEYIESLMSKIDELLPPMYKGLKMLVAGLYSISEDGLSKNVFSDAGLRGSIRTSMHEVRAVLCLFDEIMRSRQLPTMPLPNVEVPDINQTDKLSYALLVYRDTLNYLEYISQVFQKMYEIDSKN